MSEMVMDFPPADSVRAHIKVSFTKADLKDKVRISEFDFQDKQTPSDGKISPHSLKSGRINPYLVNIHTQSFS